MKNTVLHLQVENKDKKMDHNVRRLEILLVSVFLTGLAFGQTYLINESFGTVPPSGWINGSPAPTQGTSAQDGDSKSLLFSEGSTGAAIVTLSVTDPDRISFYHLASNNGYSGTFNVNYSTSSSGPWTNLVSVASTAAWAQSATELSLPAGAYYLQLIRTSATRKDLFIDVFQASQSIVRSTTALTGFLAEPDAPSPEKSFTVSGVNLTNNITITSPTNYEISTGTGAGFSATNPITLTQTGGSVSSTTIYVRLKSGLSAGAYNGENITISSTDKISKTIACSGDVRQSINRSTSSLSYFCYDPGSGPSAEQNFTVSGQDLTADITLTPPANYEISTGTGAGFSATNPITLTQSGGAVASTTIYVRLKAGLSAGSYNSENITISSTGKVSRSVACSGFVGARMLNIKVFFEGCL